MTYPAPRWDHVLVTGASAGIGVAFAEALAPRARLLTLTARREDRLRALAARLEAAHPGLACHVVPADLGAEGGASAFLAALRAFGSPPVDVLVNNAGYGRHGAWDEFPWDDWERMFRLNMVAAAQLLHAFWPDLTAVPGRGALNIASAAGFQPIPWFAGYSATKAFLRSLSNALSAEARAHGTRILSVCPGPTTSEFGQVAGSDFGVMKARMSAESVVELALRAYAKGRPEVVTGRQNALVAAVASRVPLRLVLAVTARMARRRGHAAPR